MKDPRLSDAAKKFIADSENTILVSAATAWEIAIKHQTGKLVLPDAPDVYVPSRIDANRFWELDITVAHALHIQHLPLIHRDPFDRILIAQSIVEDVPILTADPMIARYGVAVVW